MKHILLLTLALCGLVLGDSVIKPLPTQNSGTNGKYLRSNGTSPETWETVTAGTTYTAGTGITLPGNAITFNPSTVTDASIPVAKITGLGTAATAASADFADAINPLLDTRDEAGIYIATSFDVARTALYLSFSRDGINYQEVGGRKSLYTPPYRGGDYSIIHKNGYFWMVYTNIMPAEFSNSFGLAKSANLVDWTFVADVPTTALANVNLTYAPEFFVDDDGTVSVFLGMTTTASPNFKTYRMVPSEDFSTWSAPVDTAISDLGSNYDPTVVRNGSTYYMVYKNNSTGTLKLATSSNVAGPYTTLSQLWDATAAYEGPCIQKVGENRWIMIMEHVNVARRYSTSTDLVTWTTPVPVNSPILLKHGSITKIETSEELSALLNLTSIPQTRLIVGNSNYSTEATISAVGRGFSLIGADTSTTNTTKTNVLGSVHFDITKNPLTIARTIQQDAGTGRLFLGGGSSGGSPCQRAEFWLGDSNTNGSGSLALTITTGGLLTMVDGGNIAAGTTTGTKIGTGTTQKIGFYNATPIVQPAANADTSGASLPDLETEVNQIKATLRSLGLMAP